METEAVNKLLIRAACDIMCQAYGGQKYRLVHMSDQEQVSQRASASKDQSMDTGNTQDSVSEPRLNHTYFHSQLR